MLSDDDESKKLSQHENADGKIDNTKLNEYQRFLIKKNLDNANWSRIEHQNTQVFRNRTHNSLLQFNSTVDFKNLDFKDIAKVIEKPQAEDKSTMSTARTSDWKIRQPFTKFTDQETKAVESPVVANLVVRRSRKQRIPQKIRPRHVNRGFVPKGYNIGI
jgi:hypothetical protein